MGKKIMKRVDNTKATNRVDEEKTLQGVMSRVFDNALSEFEFNPRAGHRDQPSHPENQGLTPDYPETIVRPKARPKKLAPTSSPRPRARPANLQMRNDINKAVQQAVASEGKSPHKKGTAKYKAHMAAMHAEGYKVMPPMDPKYTERSGLEGPFTTLSGKVVYYDPKEGSYYDPDTDMYMSYDEFQQYDNDYSGMKDERDEVVSLNQMRESLKVNRSMTDNEVVAKYTRTTLDESYDTWDKINEQVQFILSMLAEGHSADSKQVIKLLQRTNIQEQADSFLNRKYKKDEVSEEMNDAEIDAFHTALDNLVHKHLGHSSHEKEMDESTVDETKYGIVRYPDTAISYIKNDGNGWEHIFDKSYGFEGPVDKEDLQYAKKIAKEKIPSRMFESTEMMTEAQFDEAAGEKDACYHKVKSRYKVWPSAYASGALVQCRKKGAKNWGNSKK